MKKVLVLIYSAFLIIILINFYYYASLYKKQRNFIVELLDRQVQLIGLEVDSTNNDFISDLAQINFSEDLTKFFEKNNPEIQYRTTERMKLFFSKYRELVLKIRIYDNSFNEFTLSKDEIKNEWIKGEFTSLDQRPVVGMDHLIQSGNEFNYYSPIFKNGTPIGNIVVTIDYKRYFMKLFSEFNLREYQWQWVIGDSGVIVFDNYGSPIKYSQIAKITRDLSNGSIDHIVHNAIINGKSREILSSYYSTQLLQRDLGLIFSAPTDFFQKYIIRNSLLIILGTLLVIQFIISIFRKYIRSQKAKIQRLNDSENTLIRLIEEMPAGVIIHKKNREILKSNKVAAGFYSFANENDMQGKLFPETSLAVDSDYFSKYLGSTFNPDQFIIIKKEVGEIILYRSSIPVIFMGENATMEILIDVTMLESARKQETIANAAKSEFLARMSYEIRTPLNGIIGMADVLNRYDLKGEVKEIVNLLRKSIEVLLKIINDILDYSKIESGKIILDEIPFDLQKEITYSVELAKAQISQNNLSLNLVIDDKVPESIIGDPFRLRQILTNLINHSIKNTEEGEIEVRCKVKDNKNGIITLTFEILDSGTNFDRASLKRIFGDFVNAESMSIRSNEESDFGTILAKQLVNLMGGELTAVCPSGLSGNLGTKVTFTINTYLNDRPVKELDVSHINRIEQIRTLVITGSQNRDEELLGTLHKFGMSIAVTTFQKLTVYQIKINLNIPDDKYHLIIILGDEDFDGFDVARVLSENKLSRNFIIILISANDKKGNYLKCITLGIDYYLVKPFDKSELLNAIQNSFTEIKNPLISINNGISKDNLHILLVEDNRMSQRIIGKMLESLGCLYELAEDGYEGYMKAKTKKFDIIFMDLFMPEMDGFESSRKILEYNKSSIIVAITADKMLDTKRKAELSGIKEFISKPVRIEDLEKLFAKYFNK